MSFLKRLDRVFGLNSRYPGRWFDRGRLYFGLAAVGLFVVVYPIITLWEGHQDRVIADRLRQDGVEVDAVILRYRDSNGDDEVRVAFDRVDGGHVEGWVIVGSKRAPGPTRVRYLPSDPTVARLADDLEPRRSEVKVMVVVYLFLGAVVVAIIGTFRAFDRSLGLRR
jgi:hypothetical protein